MLKKILFSSLFTVILFIVAEIVLSFFIKFPNDYYTATPNSGFTWEINPKEIIGINRNSEVQFDELGARSISNFNNKNKIVVFGGSTTACFALTQSLTWTALLEKKTGKNYWVGNFGRPGNSSNHHVLQFKHILHKPQLKDVKTVIIMQGVNDFVGHLISPERYINSSEKDIKKIAFQHVPDSEIPFFKSLTLYKLLVIAKNNLSFYFIHKDHLTNTASIIRSLRQQSKLVNELPSLKDGLDHYESNILKIIDLANQKKINLIFITQATMWKPNLDEKYEKLLLTSGFDNNNSFYSTNVLYYGMEIYNERLKKVCAQNNISIIDLDLPKTTESFYDDYHFNESGANLLSDKIYEYLITHENN
jgi:lysophospholipase L1-like esterase